MWVCSEIISSLTLYTGFKIQYLKLLIEFFMSFYMDYMNSVYINTFFNRIIFFNFMFAQSDIKPLIVMWNFQVTFEWYFIMFLNK